ncbi:MAG: glutamine-hydrolyzing carbamoyl-phosphate synthase small subunit [bacterium]
MRAYLVLQDGTVFEGDSLGAEGFSSGEVVFNTGMTGYQEILTDPSYAGQIVMLTYPLIGNYGINDDDFESDKVQPRGLIVREACTEPSNWRSRMTLEEYMKQRNIIGLQGVDTRAITRKLRSYGVMMGTITSTETPDEALKRLQSMKGYGETDFVDEVSTKEPYAWGRDGREAVEGDKQSYRHHVVVLDMGTKYNILRRLAAQGCRSVVVPCTSTAEEIMAYKPEGVVLSPGPGDPARLGHIANNIKDLLGRTPIMGICLGHQIIGTVKGGSTFKLKFGHRGSNHPVKDLVTNQVTITSQNHGYAVSPEGLNKDTEVARVNLNDGTVEGLQIPKQKVITIQYHPEASPGPWDSRGFFASFVQTIEETCK